MIKACIFDLDGVVVDTAKYHYLAWKRLANQLGFDFSEHDNEKLKGVSRMESLEIMLNVGKVSLSMEQKVFYAEMKNQWYREFILAMKPDEVLPGAIDLFKALREKGIKIALGSASKNAQTILDRTNISSYFDVVIDGNKTQKAKPNPEVILLAANGLGVLPQDCIVFEDAEAGIEAAVNAGMKCVGIGRAEILGKANMVIDGLHQMSIDKLNI